MGLLDVASSSLSLSAVTETATGGSDRRRGGCCAAAAAHSSDTDANVLECCAAVSPQWSQQQETGRSTEGDL